MGASTSIATIIENAEDEAQGAIMLAATYIDGHFPGATQKIVSAIETYANELIADQAPQEQVVTLVNADIDDHITPLAEAAGGKTFAPLIVDGIKTVADGLLAQIYAEIPVVEHKIVEAAAPEIETASDQALPEIQPQGEAEAAQ